MNLRPLVAVVAVVLVVGWVALRHRTVRRLEGERTALQVQAAEAAKLRAAMEQLKPATVAAPETPLTGPERAELLRLRGEIGRLRRDLAQQQATNRPARAPRPTAAPSPAPANGASEEEVTRQQAILKLNSGRQWMLASMLFAEDNAGQLPANLADATQYSGGASGMDDFEILVTGDIHAVTSPATTIVLREKQAWKGRGGKWNRTYAFADGHTEIASSSTEDFTVWEERKRTPPSPAPREPGQ
jgi:hypothetical protein